MTEGMVCLNMAAPMPRATGISELREIPTISPRIKLVSPNPMPSDPSDQFLIIAAGDSNVGSVPAYVGTDSSRATREKLNCCITLRSVREMGKDSRLSHLFDLSEDQIPVVEQELTPPR